MKYNVMMIVMMKINLTDFNNHPSLYFKK